MTDARLRKLERRWRQTGAEEDEARFLLERARTGDLARDKLELAAYLGYPAARRALGDEVPQPDQLARARRIHAELLERYPASELDPLTLAEVARVEAANPGVPWEALLFLHQVSCGRVGEMRFMFYAFIDPDEIWDPETAARLEGIRLLGDTFSGRHLGYSPTWELGWVSVHEGGVDPGFAGPLEFCEQYLLGT